MKRTLLIYASVLIMLSGCSASMQSPRIPTELTADISVQVGDYTYSADLKITDNVVYVTPTSTNAAGMTISCDGKDVTFIRRDMLKKADMNSVSPYNPASLLYSVFFNSAVLDCEKEDDVFVASGKFDMGKYIITFNNKNCIDSLYIENADFFVKFIYK